MHTDYAELLRLLLNLIRLGYIAEVDHVAKKVRVQIGKNLTNWRPWATQRAGEDQTWWPPSVDEQVIVFSPNGDFNQSIIFMAAYSDNGPAPSDNPAHHTTNYSDGAVIQYDKDSHALSAILPKGSSATVKADKVTSDAPNTFCTGNLTVAKNLIVGGMSSLNAGMAVLPAKDGAPACIKGDIAISGDAVISGISVVAHKHPVIAIGADTGSAK
jgi:phage baseplate assembly protein V